MACMTANCVFVLLKVKKLAQVKIIVVVLEWIRNRKTVTRQNSKNSLVEKNTLQSPSTVLFICCIMTFSTKCATSLQLWAEVLWAGSTFQNLLMTKKGKIFLLPIPGDTHHNTHHSTMNNLIRLNDELIVWISTMYASRWRAEQWRHKASVSSRMGLREWRKVWLPYLTIHGYLIMKINRHQWKGK